MAGLGLSYIHDVQARQASRVDRTRDAYIQFLVAAAGQIAMATTVHESRKLGTGAFRFQNLIRDPVEFLRSFNREYMQLFNAWAQVWLSGSPGPIEASNRFVDAAIPAIEAAQAAGRARPALLARLLGEAWTTDQEKQYGEALTALGRLRIEFAKVARAELGEQEIELVVGLHKANWDQA